MPWGQYRKDLLAAYLGLGSCWALLGRMEDAVGAFSSAIELDPKARVPRMFLLCETIKLQCNIQCVLCFAVR